jgi:glycosyltransferase involved in cell wall biosynthesis
MAAQIAKRIPHIVTVHGGDVFGLQGRAMAWIKSRTLRSADAVTVNSSFTENAVLALAPGMTPPHRIPMGVSSHKITREQAERARQLRERYRLGKGPLLLFVGRIVEEKGVEDLVRSVAMLRGWFPDVNALVVGEGQDRAEMERLTESLGISEKIVFTGWVQPDEVRTYLAAADIFIGPSRTAEDGWVEAQGLTFLEAMMAETPVIGSRLGGIVDSVEDGVTGLLVDERRPDEIVMAVRRLMTDTELRRTLTLQAYRRVRERFSREASAEAFSGLFLELQASCNP